MEIRPIFSELGPSYLVTDLEPLPDPGASSSSTNRDGPSFSKFELFDLFSPSALDGDSSDLLRTAMALPLLVNCRLLQEGLPGSFEFLPPDRLSPCADFYSTETTRTDPTRQQYCVLPYEVGRALYEFFDLSARQIPATTFKR